MTLNETISVPSHKDMSEKERVSYYVQKDEYAGIKQDIQRTVVFLKSPNEASCSSIYGSGLNSATNGNAVEEEHCVRGLESLVATFVNDHKKRAQKSSRYAVFRFQDKRKSSEKLTAIATEEADNASIALAEVYKRCTSECENIARRWGYFDAIDAGIDPTSSSLQTASASSTVISLGSNVSGVDNSIALETLADNNASLSSISYDGDENDGEEENESTNDFNSLPDELFN